MDWNILTTDTQLAALVENSKTKPQVIYKHSTRCSTSTMIKNRLERSETPASIEFHYLDLIAYRSLSDKIADDFGVQHESPQVLVICDGRCIFHESHYAIYMDAIAEQGKRA